MAHSEPLTPESADPANRATQWHTLDSSAALQQLTSAQGSGLSTSEAQQRLQRYGRNELTERAQRGALRILWEQLSSTMVLILVAAGAVAALLGEDTEAIAIFAIVVMFAALGFLQEYRAEKAMAALKQLARPIVRVRRDGRPCDAPAAELVPGDVVMLEAGSVVPADARMLESATLRVQEAALTGESEPVEKSVAPLTQQEIPLGDQVNRVFMGTSVIHGRGEAVVTETGMATELGRIATMIQDVETGMTPLQRRLDRVGKMLALVGLGVAAVIVAIGLFHGQPLAAMFLTAVSVAVAVVPEGLPAVVTVTLALGAQRMLKRRALVRKLPAVETLGSVTVICSDKTGTLTENRMRVMVVDVADQTTELRNAGPDQDANDSATPRLPDAAMWTLTAGVLCSDATLEHSPEGDDGINGDPTEGALLLAAAAHGADVAAIRERFPRVAELPFDSERKRMTTVHRLPSSVCSELPLEYDANFPYVSLTKGSVDGLLDHCVAVAAAGQASQPMSAEWRKRIEAAHEQLASQGMRLLGVAMRTLAKPDSPAEDELTFLGLVAMIDPPRTEVAEAIKTCVAAGIRTIMITGDHPLTARFIAKELGVSKDDRVMTGAELSKLDPDAFREAVNRISVFARVAPEHKLQIVECLQAQGEIVAMTGDGVNDSPALRKADIGIAMGITGSDVSKEVSEMVLLDDNFATIVAAVEEGRAIFANIRRFVKFSVAGNLGKVLVMLLSPLVGITVALQPLQLLWLNLLTDGLLGLGLGLEPVSPTVMNAPPRKPDAPFFPRAMVFHLLWVGTFIGLAALGLALYYHRLVPGGQDRWQTVLFNSLAFLQVGQAFASRSTLTSTFKLGLMRNRALLGMAVITMLLQLGVLYLPALQPFFKVVPLQPQELAICFGMGLGLFAIMELEKAIGRARRKGQETATLSPPEAQTTS